METKITLKKNASGKQYFSMPKSLINEIVAIVEENLAKKYNAKFAEIGKKIDEILQDNKNINTNLRGLDQYKLRQNAESVKNLLSLLKNGIDLKFE